MWSWLCEMIVLFQWIFSPFKYQRVSSFKSLSAWYATHNYDNNTSLELSLPPSSRGLYCFDETKGIFCFGFIQWKPLRNSRFFAYVISRKRSANQRKKNQNSVYRVKLSPHAKIQLLLNTFKNGRKIKGLFLLWAFQLCPISSKKPVTSKTQTPEKWVEHHKIPPFLSLAQQRRLS